MFIIDSHVRQALGRPFNCHEHIALMDEAGVDRALLVSASRDAGSIDYAFEACETYPDRFGIVARIPQDEPIEGASLMRELAQNPYVKGVSLTFDRQTEKKWMIDGTCDWYWPLAEKLGIPTMVHAPIWKAELGRIAQRHPDLKIVIDHMGIMEPCTDDAIDFWVTETADLYENPNIYVKLSAVPCYSTHPFPNLNIVPFIRRLVGKMGARRCFWGADLSRLAALGLTYHDSVQQFTGHFGFTEGELEWIMGRGIGECLGWGSPADVQA